jgi:glycosyltransferase involved in cell wall biosynthesis
MDELKWYYSMKNILFISYDGMTDPLGQSQVIPYLAGLTRYDYQFTILSCEKQERFILHKNEIENLLRPYPIKWVSIPYHKKPPVFSTIYDVYHLKKKAKQLHLIERFDMVHTRPGIPALIGLWMKEKAGVKFLNDIREFYADSRVDGGMWNLKNFFYKRIYKFFKQKEIEAVGKSDGIVCLTNAAEKIIAQWPQYMEKIPLRVIPCSVDMNLFDPEKIDNAQKLKLKKELKINDDDFIISYLGSIGSWYLTNEMMRFFKVINDKIPAAKFLFISPNEHETIADAARKSGLPENKLIVTKARRSEVSALLSFSKFSVFFIKPCYSKQSSSPTKHGEIMAMGIPLITNAGVGDVANIVEKYHSGIVLKDLNQEEFISAANGIRLGVSFDSNTIRNGAKEYYNLDNAIEKYHEIYQKILKEK